MRAVEHDVGVGRDVFQASRPASFGDSLRRHAQLLKRQRRGDGVVHLMLSRERDLDPREAAAARVDLQVADLEIGRAPHADAEFRGPRIEHRLGLRPLPREYRRHAALQNPSLFARDLLDGVAQEDLVIEIDRRDHGERRVDYVSRVQPPAQADFDHGRLHA